MPYTHLNRLTLVTVRFLSIHTFQGPKLQAWSRTMFWTPRLGKWYNAVTSSMSPRLTYWVEYFTYLLGMSSQHGIGGIGANTACYNAEQPRYEIFYSKTSKPQSIIILWTLFKVCIRVSDAEHANHGALTQCSTNFQFRVTPQAASCKKAAR